VTYICVDFDEIICDELYRCRALYCPANAHNLKNVELLKQYKIKEDAPTCFGLQGNHHQWATASTYLKLHTRFNVDTWRSYRRCQCYGCIVWPVRRVCCALTQRTTHTMQP